MCFYTYILYVFAIRFCDKSGFSVSMIYLTDICNARDHEAIGKIAWGFCGLTYLYYHLGEASR